MSATSPIMPRFSLEEQVGQVIMATWTGDSDRLAALIALDRVGGLLISPGTHPALAEWPAVLNRLQRLASYPLLFAADLGPLVAGELALGAARRPELAHRCGAATGALARALGIHLVLGPGLDVHREAAPAALVARSFGENPSLAGHLGAAVVEGCQAQGALAVARHFPGRGNALYDAGRILSTLPQDRQTLEKIDLLPYVEACRAGVAAVMSGHLHVAALDNLANRLATHSSAVVEGLLRGTLGFRGLLLSDNLDAPEVSARYAPGQAAVLAFAAGHDLLVTSSPEEVYQALYEVLLHGDVPRTRLREAVGRVWAAKERLGLPLERFVPEPGIRAQVQGSADGYRAHLPAFSAAGAPSPDGGEGRQALAREVAEASLTLLRGHREMVARSRAVVATCHALRGDGSAVHADLGRLTAAHLAQATFHTLDPRPAAQQLEATLDAASSAGAALLFLSLPPGGQASPATEALVALAPALKRLGVPLGVVAMGNPYALSRFPAADLLLYLPSDTPPYLEAAFAYLLGQIEAPGKLPVTVG